MSWLDGWDWSAAKKAVTDGASKVVAGGVDTFVHKNYVKDTAATAGEYPEGWRLQGNAEWHAPLLPPSGNLGTAARQPAPPPPQSADAFLHSDTGKIVLIGGALLLAVLLLRR